MTEDERKLIDMTYAGILKIGRDGLIWKVKKKHKEWKGYRDCTPKLQGHDKDGYLRLGIRDETGKTRRAFAHRLVFMYFYGDIPDGLQVNHKNGKRNENWLDNLELMTSSQQMIHAIHVLGRKIGAPKGNSYWKNRKDLKLTENDYEVIRKSNVPRMELAKQYGVTPERISQVKLYYGG